MKYGGILRWFANRPPPPKQIYLLLIIYIVINYKTHLKCNEISSTAFETGETGAEAEAGSGAAAE